MYMGIKRECQDGPPRIGQGTIGRLVVTERGGQPQGATARDWMSVARQPKRKQRRIPKSNDLSGIKPVFGLCAR